MMSINNWFLQKFIMRPVMSATGRPVFSYLQDLQASQWWSRENLLSQQAKRLRDMMEYAYEHVPYYHSIMNDHCVSPENFEGPSTLSKLPFLTKDLIRQNFERMKSDEFKRMKKNMHATGGSTGDPLQIWLDIRSWSQSNATRYRGWGMAGYDVGDKIFSIGGMSLYPGQQMNWSIKMYHNLERNTFLSGIELSDQVLAKHTDLLLKEKPKFLYGYASSLFIWANYLLRLDISIDFLQGVFSTSEVLYPDYRVAIEKAFNCKVFDGYGARDGNISAFECNVHQGYHLSAEACVVEIVDPKTGEATSGLGDIVVTDLYNFCFPMIRYKIGDSGRLVNRICSCGRGLPILEELSGRTGDVFRFDNGKILTGPAFTVLFKNLGFVKYQIRQLDGSTVLIQLVKSKNYKEEDTHIVEQIFHHHLGNDIKIHFEFLSDIPSYISGKRPYFISYNHDSNDPTL
jgi:phenylacetate-CoA ligase